MRSIDGRLFDEDFWKFSIYCHDCVILCSLVEVDVGPFKVSAIIYLFDVHGIISGNF